MPRPPHNDPGWGPYGPAYWAGCCGEVPYGWHEPWLTHFATIADRLVEQWHPRTVLDVGCGWGLLVAALRDRGVEAYGIDVSAYAVSQARPDIAPYVRVGSVIHMPAARADVITCIEVLEHIPAPFGPMAARHLSEGADRILFSASPDDDQEPTHVNLRPPAYWSRLFDQLGFDTVGSAWWVAPHGLLLERRSC
jgi:predicted TPR repeat methyltransferase